MVDSSRSWVGFGGESLAVDWCGAAAQKLIDFLCCDLQRDMVKSPRKIYQLYVNREASQYSLKNDQQQFYAGDDYYELAYALINEIIYQVIVDKKDGLAIHAGAVGTGAGGVLLPGESGSGKSTFTAWLLSCGCRYLTDELVVLDVESSEIDPFTRPVSFKTGSVPVVQNMISFDAEDAISGSNGLMLPHRLFNQNFNRQRVPLSLILFPRYRSGVPTTITPLSGALGCARLIECYVNARNIKDHGIGRIAQIIRNTPVYQVTYGSFDGLYESLQDRFPAMFQ